MRRPTRFERDLRNLHGPDVIDFTRDRPRHFSIAKAKASPWEIQVFAVLMTPVVILIALALAAAGAFGLYCLWLLATA